MINIEFSSNIILGIFLIIAVLILYFLRTIKYELSRDSDIFFATLGFAYSFILIVHGWRLDPILIFGQLMIILMLVAIGWENIRLRGIIVEVENQQFFEPYDDTLNS